MAADIHALELEFAKNSTLDACIPLCQAYLGAKRYMEAMVVCKKGIKNAPTDPRGRILLSRVYMEQGKLPKAETELNAVMQAFPGNPNAGEMMGQLLITQGRNQEAVPFLQQAVTADPTLEGARNMLAQLGIAAPAPVAAPQAAAPQAAAPQAAPPQAAPPQAAAPMGQPMPQQAQPGMPPQGQPMPGAPAGSPWASGTDPALAPPTTLPPGNVPPGMPNPAPAGVQPQENAPKLEHVSDFFADETLGFADGGDHIETAGPGRLTILGFVPKSTGSIKTTIFVALGVFAIASVFIFWQYVSSQNTKRINKYFGEVRLALEEDKSARYHDALRTGKKILEIDSSHNLTLSAMAYAEGVLGSEHAEEGSIGRAKDYVRRAMEASDEENEFRVSARAILAFEAGKFDEGVADVKKILDKGGSSAIIELEAFRLMNVTKPGAKETQIQLRRAIQSVVSQTRIHNHLGWYYYEEENWSQADRYFDQALQNSRGHPTALLGQALTDLGRAIGLKERQKEIAKNIKKVFALPPDELSPPVLALAHFARGMLKLWQLDNPVASERVSAKDVNADFKKAFELDSKNPMFHYRQGVALLKQTKCREAIESLKKAIAVSPNIGRYYKKLGEAQVCAGQGKEAKATLERALELSPDDAEIKLREAQRLLAEKQYDEAIAKFELISNEDGAVIYCRAAMGKSTALRESGQKAKAITYMEAFFEVVPSGCQADIQAELWCELGENYDSARKKEQAIQAFTVGIEQYPYYPKCHYLVAMAVGRGPEAKEACKRYLALAPRGKYAARCEKKAGK